MAIPTPIHSELHRIATTGIIWREVDGVRTYLATKRSPSKKAWPGKWTVPGGGLKVEDYIHTDGAYQNSESPQWYDVLERALAREIKEEVGLAVDQVTLLQNVAFIRPDGVPVVVFSFYCKYASGDVVLNEDATEYAWLTAEEAQSYDFIQGIEKEILEADNRLSSHG
ncbi:MAG TPA: NUDIX domain-containing protein [Candidatus Paceibacterota bacterium]|nr:NUDIX domain-containing protein [Candidatus Paceibacterota bacterium]